MYLDYGTRGCCSEALKATNQIQVVKYTIPHDSKIVPNRIYLAGEWKNNNDHMELQSELGRILTTRDLLRQSTLLQAGAGELNILEDNSKLDNSSRGTDISEDGTVKIDGQRLYNIVGHEQYGNHNIAIEVVGKGFQIYTFTFG